MATIYALASGRPPAAIAMIRVSGPLAHHAGRALAGDLPSPRKASVRSLRSADGELLDEALVLRFDGNGSATGEDVVEFHCHGGRAVVDAVLASLKAMEGLRLAEPGEFTRRAFENGRIDLTEAEGLADLLEAETQTQRRAALATAGGGLRHQVEMWQTRLIELSARAEAAIDYIGEDGLGHDEALAGDCRTLANELASWLSRPRVEPLRDGVRVAIAGPPNAGKSSLLNAIAGYDKAIVSEIAGTTRDEIELAVAVDGLPFVFVDTAGLRQADDAIERIGVARAESAVERAEILLWLGEPAEMPGHGHAIQVASKADLSTSAPPPGSVSISAATGEGIRELLALVAKKANVLLPAEGSVALNRRQADAMLSVQRDLEEASRVEDEVIRADSLRSARGAFDRLTGRAGLEEVLDQLFSRFCLGK